MNETKTTAERLHCCEYLNKRGQVRRVRRSGCYWNVCTRKGHVVAGGYPTQELAIQAAQNGWLGGVGVLVPEAVFRRFYDAERHRVMRAAREIRKEAYSMGKARPVRRSDGAVFPSILDAADALGVCDSSVWQVLAGKAPTVCGYRFEYVDEEDAPKPGTPKSTSGYANGAVYRDMMRKLARGKCKQCKHYSAGGGQHWCNRGPKRYNTDPGATCPRWDAGLHVETLEETRRRKAAEREDRARRLRESAEARAQAERERAALWEFRGDVLGAQVGQIVEHIRARYDIGPGTGER